MARFFSVMAVALMLSMGTGCIFKSSTTQGSFESSSTTVSAPFKSLSKSSKSSKSSSGDDSSGGEEKTTPAPEESAYERDVRQYTASYASTGGDAQGLQRDLRSIAEEYGVTDWERHDETYSAIGRGLGEGPEDAERAERLAVGLASDDRQLALIRAGYETPDDR
jgi:hypothetical protein